MSWTHVEDRAPVARKRHRCYGCWGAIEIGEKHAYRFGYGESGPESVRLHTECMAYMDSYPDSWETHSPGDYTRDEAREWAQIQPAEVKA